MMPYPPAQPRTCCVELDSTNSHRPPPWNAMSPGFQPPASAYPFRQGATASRPETAATSQLWRVATSAPQRPHVDSGVNPLQVPKPASVKHLTCYFWAKNGVCKFSEEDCLYAHRDTGKVAQGPLQVELGRPAVAGRNATAVKPIYQNWRGGSADGSSHTSKSSQGTITDPEIQGQIRYIGLKAKANAMAYDSASMNIMPHKRRQSEATSPIYDFFPPDSQRVHGLSPSSLASTDHILENQVQVLTKTTETLSSIIERSMQAFDGAAAALQADVETLVEVYAIDPAAAGDSSHLPPHMDQMSTALHRITRVALDLSHMACLLNDTRSNMTKELDSAGLQDLAPLWQNRNLRN